MLSTRTDRPVTQNPVIDPPSTARRKALSEDLAEALATFALASVEEDMPIIEPVSETNTPRTETAATCQLKSTKRRTKSNGVAIAIVFICLFRYARAPVAM
ncbi:hypothetical protein SDC9_158780 [bioreactor metagenome]|uniref:Uncharacterized protein n=1 Tax=bioreactor metagenome TaxID=1076179 RepID=A0A645FB48_9ZZZZ